MLTYEEVASVLRYDPESGKLYWLHRPENMFPSKNSCSIWNSKHAGKEAFITVSMFGYKQGTLFGRCYRAARVCWLLSHGVWPTKLIDHIDGVRTNDRLKNLRDVGASENMKNRAQSRNNKSGVTGVYWNKDWNKWHAQIKIDGKTTHLGVYNSREKAAAIWQAAADANGYSARHGKPL